MYKTEQERFWAGEFGNDYAARNCGPQNVAAATALFAKVLARTHGISSVLELGANIGLNMRALHHLLPSATLDAVEINESAFTQLRTLPGVTAHHASILEYKPLAPVDFAFTKGVLIHIAPEEIAGALDTLYTASRRYIGLLEYYNITPMEVPYRGHGGRLFKRDWCADLLKRHPDLRLLDYGFVYHGDPSFSDDDITWFLLEKPIS